MAGLGMLSVEDQERIEGHLKGFLEKSESIWAAVVDRGGSLFAQIGDSGAHDMSVMSALSAGSFAATKELAKRLGEVEFSALFHEGRNVSILMSSLDFDCLVLTVFDERTNIGLVRFYAQQITESLNQCLHQASEAESRADPLRVDIEMREGGPSIIQ